jgi:hypothetical protein
MNVIRAMLLEVEAKEGPVKWVSCVDGDADGVDYGFGDQTKNAHFNLMLEANLVNKIFSKPDGGVVEFGYSLTWAGHDYLDSVRDQTIWNKTVEAVAETGGSAALEVVKAVAMGFAKKKISQHTGIEI